MIFSNLATVSQPNVLIDVFGGDQWVIMPTFYIWKIRNILGLMSLYSFRLFHNCLVDLISILT